MKIMRESFFFNLQTYLSKKKIKKKNFARIFFNTINNYYNFQTKKMNIFYLYPADDIIRLYFLKFNYKVLLSDIYLRKWFFFKVNKLHVIEFNKYFD